MMDLLEHNQATLEELEKYTSRHQDVCVVNPCGSGKSSVMSAFVEKNSDKKIIIFTKQINAREYYLSLDKSFHDVSICTYGGMLSDYKRGRIAKYNADIYIADEAHYLGAARWGEVFSHLRELYNPLVVGFTATPQRFFDQGTDRTVVSDFFDGNSAGNYTTRDLQKKGLFVEPEYILSLWDLSSDVASQIIKVKESDLSDGQKERHISHLNALLDEWNKSSRPEIVLAGALPRYMHKEFCNRILVYLSSREEINNKQPVLDQMIRSVFGSNAKSYRYTSKDGEGPLKEYLKEDNTYIKILYSIDKIMETIHIDDLNIVLMLRPSVSNRIITQQFGRINSIGNRNKSLIIDMVDNLSNLGTVNFLGGTAEEKSEQKHNISMFHVAKYHSVFQEIDNALKRFPAYHYNGFTGSLSQICSIYNKNYIEVKNLLKNHDLTDALMLAHGRKPRVTQAVFDEDYTRETFPMIDVQREYVTKYMSSVDRFIKDKGITDDDVKQELYIELMYAASKIRPEGKPQVSAYILTHVNHRYTFLMKMKTIRKSVFVEEPVSATEVADYRDMADQIFLSDRSALESALDTIQEREKVALEYYFGFNGDPMTFESCGKKIGVSRNRAKQIVDKAIRRLQAPLRASMFKDMAEALHDVEWTNQGSVTVWR